MTIKALLFDVDGTLADTEEAHRQAFNVAFAREGLSWQWTREQYAALLRTTGGKERIAAHIETLGLTTPQRDAIRLRIPAIHRTKTTAYTAAVRAGALGLQPGVRRLIDEARQAHVRLAIASTTTLENIEALLAAVARDANDWFDVIVAGDDVQHKKPAPDVYLLALDRLGVQAADGVAFEDSANGLRAAQGAGLFTVVTPTFWTRGEPFDRADLVLASLGDADHPLTGVDARKVGNTTVGLAELSRLTGQRDLEHKV